MSTTERLLYLADSIAAHGRSITYPSRMAAQEVRNVVRELADALRSSVGIATDDGGAEQRSHINDAERVPHGKASKP